MPVSKPTTYAIGAFSGTLVFWAVTNSVMADLLANLGIIFRPGVVGTYFWLLTVDWAIGLAVALFVACVVYRHFSD